jgi:glutathione-regulated potassium-efflux system ancillary protein KefG
LNDNEKILVLYAHPSHDRSEINSQMARIASNTEGVLLVDLYARYPTFEIDVRVEQQQLLDHDVIADV